MNPTIYLLSARSLRDFGDGFVSVLLPAYLLALGFTPLQVGAMATASLLGSALLTIAVGFLGVRYDHRQLLLAASSLMIRFTDSLRMGGRSSKSAESWHAAVAMRAEIARREEEAINRQRRGRAV